MDQQLSKIKDQITKIETLRNVSEWGPEYQLWEKATGRLVKEVFGEDSLKLFKQQQTVTFSYLDDDYNHQQYQAELNKRKTILEGLLSDMEESKPTNSLPDSPKDVLKEIWRKEEALKENLLPTEEAQSLQLALLEHLEKTLAPDSLPGLRFRKMKSGKPQTWWSSNGYPTENPWPKFQPFLEKTSTGNRRVVCGVTFQRRRSAFIGRR